jgi:uncharacterized protein
LSVLRTARSFLLVAALFGSAGALAADSTAPAATAAPPSAAAVTAADAILGDLGIKQSIALVVPEMLTQLERNVTRTRPEIRDSLRQTLRMIQPEFDKRAEQMYTQAAVLLASQMSGKELQDVAAFFGSPVGKKYLAAQPVFLQKFAALVQPWRDQLSMDIMIRTREEMKKKGIELE